VNAPVVLVICGTKGLSGYYNGQASTEKGDWLMFDLGIAMQTLCLAAHAQAWARLWWGCLIIEKHLRF